MTPPTWLGHVIAPSGADLRTHPTRTAPVIRCIVYGDQLRVHGVPACGGEWYPATYEAQSGFVLVEEVSPCKHCGKPAYIVKNVVDPHLCWSVSCSNLDCGIHTGSHSQQQQAVDVWIDILPIAEARGTISPSQTLPNLDRCADGVKQEVNQ